MKTTFTIYPATCRKPFRAHQRAAGDWAVDRYNPETKRIERWGLFATEGEARSAERMVNRELSETTR